MALTENDRCASADLVAASLDVIAGGQAPTGAYVAAPNYATYAYAWLRDGAFCAYAMDVRGRDRSAAAFHRFIASTLLAHRDLLEAGARPDAPLAHMPPTRYTQDGRLEDGVDEAWPNFQLDGYGTWLWVLRDHVRRGGELGADARAAAELAADYLIGAGLLPCYDCWEEYPAVRHTATLATVVAGLEAAGDLLGDERPLTAARAVRERLLAEHVLNGSFVKHEGTTAVDASLLWLALPFGVVALDDPLMVRTVARITDELVGPTGGVRRYLGDTFYGGGEWILLTAWLGWYEAAIGRTADARLRRAWIEAAATPEGHLPEQRTEAAQDPNMVDPWRERWGPVATPLLWSHAMYLVLDAALEGVG
jgi:GH15 family glucan-1,4-alpha-glucosidase